MRLYLFLILLAFFFLHGDEIDDLSKREVSLSSESEPIAIVAGCVNAANGAFFQLETDLVGNTIDQLKLVRLYDSQSKSEPSLGLGFGLQYPIFASDYQKGARHSYALIGEREGGYLTYQGEYKSHDFKRSFHIDSRIIKNGYTHGGGLKSGADLFSRSAELNWGWKLKLEDGSQRFYSSRITLTEEARKRLRLPAKEAYLLTEEIKTNGNIVEYEYSLKDSVPFLTKIKTYNRDHSTLLNDISISSLPDGYVARSSCGQQVIYKIKNNHHDHKLLSYVSTNQLGHTAYGYQKIKHDDRPSVHTVTKLQGFQVDVAVDDKRRTTSLFHTVGPNNEKLLTHTFSYGDNYTSVTDCLGKQTIFIFDDNERVKKIEYRNPETRTLIRRDSFQWNSQGLLKSKSVESTSECHHRKTYEYDDKGNVIAETVWGNITGTKKDTFPVRKEHETDHYTLKYEYSKDDFNLLLKTTTPEGIVKSYEYLPGTNLKTKDLEIYNGAVQKRYFLSYDLNGELTETIEDDGSGLNPNELSNVTSRITLQCKAVNKPGASYGKCESELKYYWDPSLKQNVLLTQTFYDYDERGNKISTKVIDSKGALLSFISKKYDSQNRLIEETDPCGYVKQFQYDFNGNKIREESLSSGKIINYSYNSTNKLICEEVIAPDEPLRITRYHYDALGNQIGVIDTFGNETKIRRDLFGNEIESIFPRTKEGTNPKIELKYNLLNQVISRRDERGFETQIRYNIYGHPIRTEEPDGTFETREYTLSGLLKKIIRADGKVTVHEYNPKGQLIKNEAFDSSGNLLSRDEYVYKSDKLLSHTDLAGLVTGYSYDSAGRLYKTQIGDKITNYERDDLGRIITQIEGDRVEKFEYDPLDRLITYQRGDGTYEKYTYDAEGNQIEVAREVAPETFNRKVTLYNSDKSIKAVIDEEGKKTEWIYNRAFKNHLNQNVLHILKKEPSERLTKTTYDARDRLVLKELLKDEVLLSCEQYEYDDSGNLIKTEVFVIEEGKKTRSFVVAREYDTVGRIIALKEGNKITRYEYDLIGRKTKLYQPNGVIINYTYDSKDNVISKKSSDDSIDYLFKYDDHNNLIESTDQVNSLYQKAVYDVYSRLIEEDFLEGLSVTYDYDQYDRVTKIHLPDLSCVEYGYNPYHLVSVQRNNLVIDDIQHDKLGRFVRAGNTQYSYDALNRLIEITSPYYYASYGPYDKNGNLLTEMYTTRIGVSCHAYSYDSLDALIQEDDTNYSYDSLGNCLLFNNDKLEINAHNQLINDGHNTYQYDLNGRLLNDGASQYEYDALGRLKSLTTNDIVHHLTYDYQNRCIGIDDQKLLYFGEKEIASYKNGLHALRIVHPEPSSELTFAIEIDNKPYLTQQDNRNNIVQLIDSNKLVTQYNYTAFKEDLNDTLSPWRFANRRQLQHLTLYTHRAYHPTMRRWLTPDPLDFHESYNLYRYVKNNPHRYLDKDGRFAFVIPLALFSFDLGVSITAIALPTLYTAMAATAATATYCGIKAIDQKYGTNIAGSLFQHGNCVLNSETLQETDIADSPKETDSDKKKKQKYEITHNENDQKNLSDVYAPDRPLPLDVHGNWAPESKDPHTILGVREGGKGKYVKAIEFGDDGELVKQIHFTDHGQPNRPGHFVPHEHPYKPNPTGGSKSYGGAQSLSTWDYVKNCPKIN
jgi:RHS repeat-associated protein